MATTEAVPYKSHFKEYMIIFVGLVVLTAIEVAIPELQLAYVWHAGWLTGLALIKAFLVGYYYMHLNHEMGWLKFIALIPMAAFVYAVVVMLETTGR
jgi:cytochrome c oxidase subunit 4